MKKTFASLLAIAILSMSAPAKADTLTYLAVDTAVNLVAAVIVGSVSAISDAVSGDDQEEDRPEPATPAEPPMASGAYDGDFSMYGTR